MTAKPANVFFPVPDPEVEDIRYVIKKNSRLRSLLAKAQGHIDPQEPLFSEISRELSTADRK